MSLLTKPKNTPTRLQDYSEVVAAENRLADFQKQHTACVQEIGVLESALNAAGEKDIVRLQARALVENRPDLAVQVQEKLHRLKNLREQRAVLEQAVALQQERVNKVNHQARQELAEALRPAHAEQVRRHVGQVLAAVKSAAELQKWEASQDVAGMLHHSVFNAVVDDPNNPNASVTIWLKELVEQGLVTQSDPLLQGTSVSTMRLQIRGQ